MAAQKAMKTNNVEAELDDMQKNSKRRFNGEKFETIN